MNRAVARSVTLGKEFASRQEEHMIRSTLHQIGFYTEETKVGQQVYHLQELSRSSFKHHHLAVDGRYNELIDVIQHRCDELSPAQLLAAALSLDRLNCDVKQIWRPLLRRFTKLLDNILAEAKNPLFVGMSPSEILLFARVCSKYERLRTHTLHRLLGYQVSHKDSWFEHDIANLLGLLQANRALPDPEILELTLNYFTKLGTKAVNIDKRNVPPSVAISHRFYLKLLRQIAEVVATDCPGYSSNGCIAILSEFSGVQWSSRPMLARLLTTLSHDLNSLPPSQLGRLCSAVAKLDRVHKPFMTALASNFSHRCAGGRMTPRLVSAVGHLFGTLQVRDSTMLDTFERYVASLTPMEATENPANARDWVMMAHTLGRLGVRSSQAWTVIGQGLFLPENQTRLGGPEIAIVANAASRSGWFAPAFWDQILKSLGQMLKLLSEKHIILCATALARANYLSSTHLTLDQQNIVSNLLLQLVRVDGESGHSVRSLARINQLAELSFCAAVDAPETLENWPDQIKTVIHRYSGVSFAEKPRYVLHDSLEACLTALNYPKVQVHAKRGAYYVDAVLPCHHVHATPVTVTPRSSTPGQNATTESIGHSSSARLREKELIIEFASPSDLCPVTKAPLGWLRMKIRHLKALGCEVCVLDRFEFAKVKDVLSRVKTLRDILETQGEKFDDDVLTEENILGVLDSLNEVNRDAAWELNITNQFVTHLQQEDQNNEIKENNSSASSLKHETIPDNDIDFYDIDEDKTMINDPTFTTQVQELSMVLNKVKMTGNNHSTHAQKSSQYDERDHWRPSITAFRSPFHPPLPDEIWDPELQKLVSLPPKHVRRSLEYTLSAWNA